MDYTVENMQVYHNIGNSGGFLSATNPYAIILNPQVNISQGTSSEQVIENKIMPSGMRLKLWVSNKLDDVLHLDWLLQVKSESVQWKSMDRTEHGHGHGHGHCIFITRFCLDLELELAVATT